MSEDAKRMLLEKTAEYAMKLDRVARAYYDQHQQSGCTCNICRDYELAYSSIGHTTDFATPPGSVAVDSKDLPEDILGWQRWKKSQKENE